MSLKEIFYKGKSTRKFATETGDILNEDMSLVKTYNNGGGYLTIGLCSGKTKNGKPTTIRAYVHRIIAELFVENLNQCPEVNHKDCNRQNNSAVNLEWVTSKDNIAHAHTANRFEKRKKVVPKRLNNEEKASILSMYAEGKTHKTIADSINRSRTTVSSFLLVNSPTVQ
jgi:hypothetical protein